MTPSERHRLAVELAVWLADLARPSSAFSDSVGRPLLNGATPPFASVGYRLWSLGAAVITDALGNPPEEQGHGAPPPHFRLLGEPEIRVELAGREILPGDLSGLIGAFVALQEHAADAFRLTGDEFRPALPAPLVDAFVRAGFLHRTGDRCRWTDLMAERVEMSAPRHSWETAAQSEERRSRTYGPIWKSMPRWLKEKVVGGGSLNGLILADAIRRFWDGDWRSEQSRDWEDRQRTAEALSIAREIERLVAAGRLNL